jgi:hypothetical protein
MLKESGEGNKPLSQGEDAMKTKIDLIASRQIQRPSRQEAGTLILVHRVTTEDGTTGLCLFGIEWDKRDMISESLYCEEQVADALREAMPGMEEHGDSPSTYRWFVGADETGTQEDIKAAQSACLTELFCCDD